MPPEKKTSRPERPRGKPHAQGGGALPVLVVMVVVLAALSFHFRSKVATWIIPNILGRTADKKTPGGEFTALGWANYIEKMGTSDESPRCCYLVVSLF